MLMRTDGKCVGMTELNFRFVFLHLSADLRMSWKKRRSMVFMSHLSGAFNNETNIIFEVKWSSKSHVGLTASISRGNSCKRKWFDFSRHVFQETLVVKIKTISEESAVFERKHRHNENNNLHQRKKNLYINSMESSVIQQLRSARLDDETFSLTSFFSKNPVSGSNVCRDLFIQQFKLFGRRKRSRQEKKLWKVIHVYVIDKKEYQTMFRRETTTGLVCLVCLLMFAFCWTR